MYDEDLIITQFQIHNEKIIKISILYDSLTFNATKRRYSIYKKKLCALIRFVMKYDYFCKHSKNMTLIHINHKSLIWFFRSNAQKNIYDYWTNKLRRLNLKIKYISKRRNQITNELFKIIFQKKNCLSNEIVTQAMNTINREKLKWIWKNEKKEYKNFFTILEFTQKQKMLKHKTLQKKNVFT
jgi:hypothetical protein